MAIPYLSEKDLQRVIRGVLKAERMGPSTGRAGTSTGVQIPSVLIKGLVKGAVTSADESFEIDNVVALGESAPNPVDNTSDTVRVANQLAEDYADNTSILAVFRISQVEDPLGGTTDIDCFWEVLKVGAGGGGTLSRAMLIGDIPAASNLNGLTGEVNAGRSSTAMAIPIAPSGAGTTNLYGPLDMVPVGTGTDEEPAKYEAVNLSQTAVEATQSHPVIAHGFLTDVGGDTVFEIISVDLSSLPGFAEGSAGSSGNDPDMQIPYHPGGSSAFELDAEECT